MKLLLDIGNTRLKWAWWDRGLKPGGAVTHAGRSPQAALEAVDLPHPPAELWAASVAAPALRDAVQSWAAARVNRELRWVASTAAACGVRNAYAQPERLGVDRWLAVIAAFHHAGGAAFVVDAGTAITVDAVDETGQHLGGLISPGLNTMRASLRGHTQLRPLEVEGRADLLARDTDAAIAWGTLHAAVGLIERVYRRAQELHGRGMPAYLTGGEAPVLAPQLPGWIVVPELVLEGLGRVSDQAGA